MFSRLAWIREVDADRLAMPGASSRLAWIREVDADLLRARPEETPEWVFIGEGADQQVIAAPWYHWCPETWQFKCLLCGSDGTWACNTDHVCSGGHVGRIPWRSKEYLASYRRVDVNEGFDYDDPWSLQYRLGIGKHKTADPPPPPIPEDDAPAVAGDQVPPPPPDHPPPGLQPFEAMPGYGRAVAAELRGLRGAVDQVAADLRDLRAAVNQVAAVLRDRAREADADPQPDADAGSSIGTMVLQ